MRAQKIKAKEEKSRERIMAEGEKSQSIRIKKDHLFVIVCAVVFVAGVFIGYQLGKPHAEPSFFSKYAADLKLAANKFNDCLEKTKYQSQIDADSNLAGAIGLTGTPAFIINGQLVAGISRSAPYGAFKKVLENELVNSTNRSLALTLIEPTDQTRGNKNAPIVIVEFSDFQCPVCETAKTEIVDKMKTEYVETGKVFFVFKNLPIPQLHPMAKKAANAALCAAEQGKFWEYHDILFEKQSEWGGS